MADKGQTMQKPIEQTIEKVGLPVKCRICATPGRVKPRTDYGGWAKRKTIIRTSWYCPDHADAVERLKTPVFGPIAGGQKQEDNSLDELMDLI